MTWGRKEDQMLMINETLNNKLSFCPFTKTIVIFQKMIHPTGSKAPELKLMEETKEQREVWETSANTRLLTLKVLSAMVQY